MSKNQIITIGRQVGSGGRLIGKMIAERLNLAFYDHEILSLAARESGIRDEFFESNDEKGSLFSRLTNYFSMSAHIPSSSSCLTSESLFISFEVSVSCFIVYFGIIVVDLILLFKLQTLFRE